MALQRSTTMAIPASQLFAIYEPLERAHMVGISKCKMIEDVVEQIAETIDIENTTGSNIRLHVIKFNIEAYVHSKPTTLSSKDFIKLLNLYPHDCTDFMRAKRCFQELVTTFQSRYKSLFLSDGMHNATGGMRNSINNGTPDFSKTYDYTVGVGNDSDVDVDNLTSLGHNYFQSTNKNDIENFIIGNIFSDVNTSHETMRVSIYVPSYVAIDSALPITHNLCNILPSDIGTLPVECNLSKTQNDNLGISIKPVFTHQTVEDLDVVLIVDESGSMHDQIHNETGFDVPIPDTSNTNPLHDLTSSAILATSNITSDAISDTSVDNLLTSLTQVLEQRLHDIHTTDTSSVFDKDEDRTNYGRKYVKYTFPDAYKVDKYYRLHTILSNCSNTDLFTIEIEINNVITRKTFYISNEFFDVMSVCEELITIEKAINKIIDMEHSSQRKNYIRELYAYVNNSAYKVNMNDMLETYYSSIDAEVHKYNILIQHIDMLYNSIMTVGERGHEMYNNHNLGSLQREISTRICRQISQTQQSQTNTGTNNIRLLEAEKDCMICYSKPKSIIYNCGHMVACKDCTMALLYENQVNDPALYSNVNNFPRRLCPTCRQTITGYVELEITNFTCCTSGCVMPPTIICCECKDLIYCKSCWHKVIRDASKKKKRKRLECKCGNNITKYIEAIY